MQLKVTEVSAAEVLPVRRRVLRDGRDDLPAGFPEDDLAEAVHVAAIDEDTAAEGAGPLAVATFFPSPLPNDAAADCRRGRATWQLRGMAVLPERQGTGVGAAVLRAGAEAVRRAGGGLLWAHARDSALGFYQRQGWAVVGEGFVYGVMGLPHHLVVLDLADRENDGVKGGA
jgi:GNAT superfamily N-acetyltransferase